MIFIPAALMLSFPLFLLGTFVVFSGVTFLQVACNPYVRALGIPSRAASRINLSQGLGAIGAFLTAYIAGFFISIMFATIYSLAIEGLGRFTNEASSFPIFL